MLFNKHGGLFFFAVPKECQLEHTTPHVFCYRLDRLSEIFCCHLSCANFLNESRVEFDHTNVRNNFARIFIRKCSVHDVSPNLTVIPFDQGTSIEEINSSVTLAHLATLAPYQTSYPEFWPVVSVLPQVHPE